MLIIFLSFLLSIIVFNLFHPFLALILFLEPPHLAIIPHFPSFFLPLFPLLLPYHFVLLLPPRSKYSAAIIQSTACCPAVLVPCDVPRASWLPYVPFRYMRCHHVSRRGSRCRQTFCLLLFCHVGARTAVKAAGGKEGRKGVSRRESWLQRIAKGRYCHSVTRI